MNELNLRHLEKRSWRANQQDGLFDFMWSVLFLGIALSYVADRFLGSGAVTMAVLIAVQSLGVFGYVLLSRRVTTPRIGIVRFAAPRKQRARALSVVLALCVAATVALVLVTALGHPPWPSSGGQTSRYTVSAIAAALIFLVVAAMAVFQEFPRILVHGALFALAEFGGTWLEEVGSVPCPRALSFGAASLASAAIGTIFLVRFLRRVPRPEERR